MVLHLFSSLNFGTESEFLSEEYKCFSPYSQIFPDRDKRERIKEMCEKHGQRLYPKYPLGYDDSQALIVFSHSTPNNTLPIIWAGPDNEKTPGVVWNPLWKRIKKKELNELNENISRKKVPFELRLPAPYHFTGRIKELKKLEELLFRDQSDRKICAIFGYAGFGKSALAYHFAESQKEKFADGVLGLRVDGKDVDTIARDFARIYGIKIDSEDERDATTIMKESFSHRKVLLIFDNADERKIDSLLDLGNNCSIILTTRDRRLSNLLRIPPDHRIELFPLLNQDSQEFFKKLIGKERFENETESAYKIIKFVGNVPLALRIIGGILETQDWLPLLDFERSLFEEKTRLSKLQIPEDKDLNVQASIALSLKYFLEENIKFFVCLSVCAKSGFSNYSAIAASGYDESSVNEHLGTLRRLCLLDLAGPKKFVFHPLVLLFAKDLAIELLRPEGRRF